MAMPVSSGTRVLRIFPGSLVFLATAVGLGSLLCCPPTAYAGDEKLRRFKLYQVEVTRSFNDQGKMKVEKTETLPFPFNEPLIISQKGSWFDQVLNLDVQAPDVIVEGKEVTIKAAASVTANLQKDAPRDLYASASVALSEAERKTIPSPPAGVYKFRAEKVTSPVVGGDGMRLYFKDGAAHVSFGVIM